LFSQYFAIFRLLFHLLSDILPAKLNFVPFLRPFTVKEASTLVCMFVCMFVCFRHYPVASEK